MEYPIVFHEKRIGSARVQQQGMYVLISCRCCSEESLKKQIYLSGFALGKCVPDGSTYTLLRRLPKREMPADPIFELREEGREFRIELEVDTPFHHLEKLPYARFSYEDEKAALLISDQISSSNNTGQ